MTDKKVDFHAMGCFQLSPCKTSSINDMSDELYLYLKSLKSIFAGADDESVTAESVYLLLEPAIAMARVINATFKQSGDKHTNTVLRNTVAVPAQDIRFCLNTIAKKLNTGKKIDVSLTTKLAQTVSMYNSGH